MRRNGVLGNGEVVEAFLPSKIGVPSGLRAMDGDPVRRAVRNVMTHPNSGVLERLPTESRYLAAHVFGDTERDLDMDYRVSVGAMEAKNLLYFLGDHCRDLDGVKLASFVRSVVGRINQGLSESHRSMIQSRFARGESIAKYYEQWLCNGGIGSFFDKSKRGLAYSKQFVQAQSVLCNAMGVDMGEMLGEWNVTVEQNYENQGVYLTEEGRKNEMMTMMDLLAGTDIYEAEALAGPRINRAIGAQWQQYLHSLSQQSSRDAGAESKVFGEALSGLLRQIDSTESCFKVLAIRGMVFKAFGESLKKDDLWLSLVTANQFLWQGYIIKQYNWFLNQG